jgi:hypothetical protein
MAPTCKASIPSTKRGQKGQAILEAALILPLLVFMLLAMGFFGFAMVERQNTIVAARFAARETSMAAMRGWEDKYWGKGTMMEAALSKTKETAAKTALPGRTVKVAPPDWRSFTSTVRPATIYQQVPLGPYAMAFVASKRLTPTDETGKPAGSPFDAGIGFVLYGQKVVSNASWLNESGKALDESRKMLPGSSREKLWNGFGLEAEAYMPSELPLYLKSPKGSYGLLDLNPWMKNNLSK